MAVASGSARDVIFSSEPFCLFIERGKGDTRVIDFDYVDVGGIPCQEFIRRRQVQRIKRMWHVDEPALLPDLGYGFLSRESPGDLIGQIKADDLTLRGLDLFSHDHMELIRGQAGDRE